MTDPGYLLQVGKLEFSVLRCGVPRTRHWGQPIKRQEKEMTEELPLYEIQTRIEAYELVLQEAKGGPVDHLTLTNALENYKEQRMEFDLVREHGWRRIEDNGIRYYNPDNTAHIRPATVCAIGGDVTQYCFVLVVDGLIKAVQMTRSDIIDATLEILKGARKP